MVDGITKVLGNIFPLAAVDRVKEVTPESEGGRTAQAPFKEVLSAIKSNDNKSGQKEKRERPGKKPGRDEVRAITPPSTPSVNKTPVNSDEPVAAGPQEEKRHIDIMIRD